MGGIVPKITGALGLTADPNTGSGERQKADALQARAVRELEKIGIPPIEAQRLVLEQPEMVLTSLAERLGPSALEGLDIDPRLKEAQMQALGDLQLAGQQGFSAGDSAAIQDLLDRVGGQQKAQDASILQNMAERGMGGSGAELAARLQSGQSAAQGARRESIELGSQQAAARRNALAQAGQLSGQMGKEQYGRLSQQASAADAIKKFNAGLASQDTNIKRVYGQEAANLANRQQTYNKGLIQQQFQNQMGKATGITGAIGNQANQAMNNAQMQAQAAQNRAAGNMQLVTGAGQAAATMMASDERVKKNIEPANPKEVHEMLSKADPYKFEYKDDKHGDGQYYGMMAQDLEKSEMGENYVQETSDGKAVDYVKMSGALAAGVSDLNKRLEKMEGKGMKAADGGKKYEDGGQGGGLTEEDLNRYMRSKALAVRSQALANRQMRQAGRMSPPPVEDFGPETHAEYLDGRDIDEKEAGVISNYADGGIEQLLSEAEGNGMNHEANGEGTIIDSGTENYAGDELEDRINDGEMVLNVDQQQHIVELLRELAMLRGDESAEMGLADINEDSQDTLMDIARGEAEPEALLEEGGEIVEPSEEVMEEVTENPEIEDLEALIAACGGVKGEKLEDGGSVGTRYGRNEKKKGKKYYGGGIEDKEDEYVTFRQPGAATTQETLGDVAGFLEEKIGTGAEQEPSYGVRGIDRFAEEAGKKDPREEELENLIEKVTTQREQQYPGLRPLERMAQQSLDRGTIERDIKSILDESGEAPAEIKKPSNKEDEVYGPPEPKVDPNAIVESPKEMSRKPAVKAPAKIATPEVDKIVDRESFISEKVAKGLEEYEKEHYKYTGGMPSEDDYKERFARLAKNEEIRLREKYGEVYDESIAQSGEVPSGQDGVPLGASKGAPKEASKSADSKSSTDEADKIARLTMLDAGKDFLNAFGNAAAYWSAANPNADLKALLTKYEKSDLAGKERIRQQIEKESVQAKAQQDLMNQFKKEDMALRRKTQEGAAADRKLRIDDRNQRHKENLQARKDKHLDKLDEQDQKRVEKYGAMASKHESTQAADKVLTNISTINVLIKDARDKGGQSLAMLGPRIAKGLAGEVGVLTEQDVTRYVTNPTLAKKLYGIATKLTQGKLTGHDAENLARLADIMQLRAEDERDKQYINHAKLLAKQPGVGLDFEEALNRIQPEYIKSPNGYNFEKDGKNYEWNYRQRKYIQKKGEAKIKNKVKQITKLNKTQNEQRKQMPDGKIAVFDIKTKKFLRYEE